jgi:hypothetical protein
LQYNEYLSEVVYKLKGCKTMVIDEIYTYIGKKSIRSYIWTALILHEGKRYPAFHIYKSKNIDDLDDFVRYLPEVKLVYSDENPTYKKFYEKKHCRKRGNDKFN